MRGKLSWGGSRLCRICHRRRSAANCSPCLTPMPALHQHAADLRTSCAASGMGFQSPLYSGQQQDYNRQGGLQSPTVALNSKQCVSSASAATRRSIALQIAKQEDTVAQLWRASHDGQVKSSCQVDTRPLEQFFGDEKGLGQHKEREHRGRRAAVQAPAQQRDCRQLEAQHA